MPTNASATFKFFGSCDFYILIRSLIQFDRFTQHRFHNHSIIRYSASPSFFQQPVCTILSTPYQTPGASEQSTHNFLSGVWDTILLSSTSFNCIFYRHPCRAGMFPHHTFISPANNIFIHKTGGRRHGCIHIPPLSPFKPFQTE